MSFVERSIIHVLCPYLGGSTIGGSTVHVQWNLRTTDTLGAGSSSVVERLSASGGFDKIN